MTKQDKLNQEQLKVQSNAITAELNESNEQLTNLSDVFASVAEVDAAGQVSEGMIEQSARYVTIISAIKIANDLDLIDHRDFLNILESEYLDGYTILTNKENEWQAYLDEKAAYEYYRDLASQYSGSGHAGDSYAMCAGHHYRQMEKHKEAYDGWVKKEERFDSVENQSMHLFHNGDNLRTICYHALEDMSNGFVDGEYVASGDFQWKSKLDIYTNIAVEQVLEKWRNIDDTWNMEAVGDIISKDASDVTALEYECLVKMLDDSKFDKDSDMEKLLSSAIVGKFTPYEGDPNEGNWVYSPSTALIALTEIYEQHLNYEVSQAKHRSDCQALYQTYSLLYAGSYVLCPADPLYGYKFDESTFDASTGYDHERLEITIERKGKCYNLSQNIYMPTDQGALNIYSKECWAYDYGALCNQVDTHFTEEFVKDEKSKVGIVFAEGVASNLVGSIPVVGDVYSWGSVIASSYDEYCNEQENIDHNSQTVNYWRVENVLTHADYAGTMIIDDDNNIYITTAYAGKNELKDYEYLCPDSLNYDHHTVIYDYFYKWGKEDKAKFDQFLKDVEDVQSEEDPDEEED